MDSFTIDPLLAYSQHSTDGAPIQPGQPRQIRWDLRQTSEHARGLTPDDDITFADLARPATQPPVDALDITCGIFPGNWPIKIRRPEGISISDVLEGIRGALVQRVSQTEYHAFSANQKTLIAQVFHDRCESSDDPAATCSNGVLRLDCLLHHTLYAGLSVSPDIPRSCILTLRRNADHRRTPSDTVSEPPYN